MCVLQAEGTSRRLTWIRRLTNDHGEMLDGTLRATGALPYGPSADRVSPRRDDEEAEYRDDGFPA